MLLMFIATFVIDSYRLLIYASSTRRVLSFLLRSFLLLTIDHVRYDQDYEASQSPSSPSSASDAVSEDSGEDFEDSPPGKLESCVCVSLCFFPVGRAFACVLTPCSFSTYPQRKRGNLPPRNKPQQRKPNQRQLWQPKRESTRLSRPLLLRKECPNRNWG